MKEPLDAQKTVSLDLEVEKSLEALRETLIINNNKISKQTIFTYSRRLMAEILPIRLKTLLNQSIKSKYPKNKKK